MTTFNMVVVNKCKFARGGGDEDSRREVLKFLRTLWEGC